jgi:hypothetical protein
MTNKEEASPEAKPDVWWIQIQGARVSLSLEDTRQLLPAKPKRKKTKP